MTTSDHLCPRCKRRPRLVGENSCRWCQHDEDLDRFIDEGDDPYIDEQERVS